MSGSLLVVYSGGTGESSERPEFPGSRTFFSLFDQIGLSLTNTHFLSTEDSHFANHLATTDARVVLCLGQEAFYRVSGIETSILDARGYCFLASDCLPIKHKVLEQIGTYKTSRKDHHAKGDPRFGLVNRETIPVLSPSIHWIIPTFDPRKVQEEALEPTPVLKADMLRSKAALGESFTLLEAVPDDLFTSGSILSLDIETIGLVGSVERIGLAGGGWCWSAPWSEMARSATQTAINNAAIIQGHNLAFDIPRLEAEGVTFPPAQGRWDTMWAQALLHPRLYKSLERSASIYLNIRPWKHLKHNDMALYNASDAFYTHYLAREQYDLLEHQGQLALFTKTIMPSIPVLMEQSRLGICVDQTRMREWQGFLRQRLQDELEEWYGHTQDINPGSNKQVGNYLYTELGMEKRLRQRGKTSISQTVDEEALHNLIETHPEHAPLLENLLRFRKVSKQLDTYAEIELSHDGCIHPSYTPSTRDRTKGATSTGRIASSHPNIQNQTPESKKLFVPHHPEWSLVEFDFSHIELRIAAALSGDRALIEALRGDVHARTMELVGCDRVRAKNLMYGTLYGAGPLKLARILRGKGITITTAECESLQRTLARSYPQLWAWRETISREGVARRYLANPFGRRRYFYDRDAVPEMFDYLPQSSAADILWQLLVPLADFARAHSGHFLTTTHDSGLFEFETARLHPSLYTDLRAVCMTEFPQIAPDFRVPIVIKTGPNWGEMKEVGPNVSHE